MFSHRCIKNVIRTGVGCRILRCCEETVQRSRLIESITSELPLTWPAVNLTSENTAESKEGCSWMRHIWSNMFWRMGSGQLSESGNHWMSDTEITFVIAGTVVSL